MGRTIDPETEIVATIGSTEAMVDTLFALTNPGDRVVMFSPFFENYRAQVIMADCEPVFVPLNPPTFSFDPNVLEACGIDSKVYSGYALGMGVERITNLKYRVKDLRMFSENDVRFLDEFEAAH